MDEININELLALDGPAFVDAAYVAFLGRRADEGGRASYLERLRTGSLTKLGVLHSLAHSEEGQAAGMRADGLEEAWAREVKKQKILRIPVIGRIARFCSNLLHINRTVNERTEAMQRRADTAERKAAALAARLDETEKRLAAVEKKLALLNEEVIADRVANRKYAAGRHEK